MGKIFLKSICRIYKSEAFSQMVLDKADLGILDHCYIHFTSADQMDFEQLLSLHLSRNRVSHFLLMREKIRKSF